jgi:outer membrane protein
MNMLRKTTLLMLLAFTSSVMFAQNFKFGHINSGELLAMMPEREQAQIDLQKFATELEEQLGLMNTELETKYADYMKNEATFNTAVKTAKQKELTDLQTRIQEFQSLAQQNYQTKEAELFQPIIDKANKAVQEIGKENGFTYIFDISTGTVVFFAETSINVLPLVKTKLGIPSTK